MEKNRIEWPVNLYRYNLGKNKGKLYPCVHVKGNIDLDGLIEAVMGERSEIRRETFRSIAQQLINKAEELLIEGYAVSTPLGTLTPTVKGMWNSNRQSAKARSENTASLNYTMSKELKKAFSNPFFKVERTPISAPQIYKLKNLTSGTKDGTAMIGDYLLMNGKFLLMNGELPERGIYFLSHQTGEQVAFIPASSFLLNSRSQIMIQVPKELPAGSYKLQVLSQCTTSPRPLKTVASGEWRELVTIMNSE